MDWLCLLQLAYGIMSCTGVDGHRI